MGPREPGGAGPGEEAADNIEGQEDRGIGDHKPPVDERRLRHFNPQQRAGEHKEVQEQAETGQECHQSHQHHAEPTQTLISLTNTFITSHNHSTYFYWLLSSAVLGCLEGLT